MAETVSIPRPLLKELYEHFDRIEEILATLEELSDKKDSAWKMIQNPKHWGIMPQHE